MRFFALVTLGADWNLNTAFKIPRGETATAFAVPPSEDVKPRLRDLFHSGSVWSRRERKRRVEVQIKAGIKRESVRGDLNHVDFMIPLKMNLAEIILVEEVIGHNEARVILREVNAMGPRVDTEADNRFLSKMSGIADIQHADLPGLKRSKDEAVTTLQHGKQLHHAAGDGDFDMRDNVFAIERLHDASVRRIHRIDKTAKHVHGDRPPMRISWNELHIH